MFLIHSDTGIVTPTAANNGAEREVWWLKSISKVKIIFKINIITRYEGREGGVEGKGR